MSPAADFVVTHSLSGKRRRRLSGELEKVGRPIMAPLHRANEFRKGIAAHAKWMQIAGPENTPHEAKTATICSNIMMLLQWRAENMLKANRLHNTNRIRLLFSGDKGGRHTKLCIAFGDVEKPNSSHNISIVGIYEGQDERKLLAHFMQPVFEQINHISSLQIRPDSSEMPIEW